MTTFKRHWKMLVVVGGAVALLGQAACGSKQNAASAIAGLPAYSAEEATLFDDGMSAPVFGLPPEDADAKKLPERLKYADGVIQGHVSTVSEEQLAGQRGYSIVVAIDRTKRGNLEGPVELHVGRGSRALPRMDELSTGLVGKHVWLFARRYADKGELALHWHLEADDAPTREAIEHGKPLDEPKP